MGDELMMACIALGVSIGLRKQKIRKGSVE